MYVPTPASQIPILCKTCGGPARATSPVDLLCDFCGTPDRLPASEIDRGLELRRRLAVAAQSASTFSAMATALARTYEDPRALLNLLGVYSGVLIVAAIPAGRTALSILRVPPSEWAFAALTSLPGLAVPLGLLLGPVLAYGYGRWRYRRDVRPLLMARPPREPGAPARCRACGGTLPDGRGPFITCAYCQTTSLVTPELQRDREALLAREAEQFRDRTHQVGAQVVKTGMAMDRVFGLVTLGTVAAFCLLSIGVSALARLLLPT